MTDQNTLSIRRGFTNVMRIRRCYGRLICSLLEHASQKFRANRDNGSTKTAYGQIPVAIANFNPTHQGALSASGLAALFKQ